MATESDDVRNAAPPTQRPRRLRKSDDRDVGTALRSAYQKTVDEAIPDDLLDLLGRLN
jgi:Anti-sigma factor NepR